MMAIQIPQSRWQSASEMSRVCGCTFFGGLGICCFALVLLHYFYKTYIPLEEAQTYASFRINVYVLCICFAAVGFVLRHVVEPYIFILLIVIALYLMTANSFRVHEQSGRLRHIEEIKAQFALLVMLFIGEGILALVMVPDQLSNDVPTIYYICAFMALGIMFNVKNIYQASQPIDQDGHALYNSDVFGAVMWFKMHIPLAVFILFTNAGFKILFMHVPASSAADQSWKLPEAYNQFFGISLMFTILCCYAVRYPHRTFSPDTGNTFIRLLLLILIPVGSAFGLNTPGYLAWCLALAQILSAIDYTYVGDADIVALADSDRPIHHHDKAFIAEVLHLDRPSQKASAENTPQASRATPTEGESSSTKTPSKEPGRVLVFVTKKAKKNETIPDTASDESNHYPKPKGKAKMEQKMDELDEVVVQSDKVDLTTPAKM